MLLNFGISYTDLDDFILPLLALKPFFYTNLKENLIKYTRIDFVVVSGQNDHAVLKKVTLSSK